MLARVKIMENKVFGRDVWLAFTIWLKKSTQTVAGLKLDWTLFGELSVKTKITRTNFRNYIENKVKIAIAFCKACLPN